MWICLSSEALLVVLLVSGSLAISQTLSPVVDSILIDRIGSQTMSSTELTEKVRDNGVAVYWLGAQSNVKYSIIVDQSKAMILTLHPKDSTSPLSDEKRTVIETFANEEAETAFHPLDGGTISRVSLHSFGRIVEYDKTQMMEAEVEFDSVPAVVRIHYPTKQSLETLIEDAKRLQLVR